MLFGVADLHGCGWLHIASSVGYTLYGYFLHPVLPLAQTQLSISAQRGGCGPPVGVVWGMLGMWSGNIPGTLLYAILEKIRMSYL